MLLASLAKRMEVYLNDQHPRKPAVFIIHDSKVTAFGKTPGERLSIQMERLGIALVNNHNEASILLSGEYIYGNSVLSALSSAAPGTILIDNEGKIAAICLNPSDKTLNNELIGKTELPENHAAKTGAELAGRYDKKLRKRTDPMVLYARDSIVMEKALFDASYKGVTDFVTKHVWPAPALIVTRWCAAAKITPNQVTWASAVLVALTFWLFWTGSFAIGLVAAWAMTFLDTIDGKLARVTLSSSKFGDILDHGIDLIHPPFWWWAWAVGCGILYEPSGNGSLILGVIVAGYILQRIEEGIFIARFGIEMHIWRPFDSFFRQITARRNPNLVILTIFTILNMPAHGIAVVAVWTFLCLVVHLTQIFQALLASRNGKLTSWLAES